MSPEKLQSPTVKQVKQVQLLYFSVCALVCTVNYNRLIDYLIIYQWCLIKTGSLQNSKEPLDLL